MIRLLMPDLVTRQTTLARSGAAAARTAIFLHIGKTAGTTLNAVLDHQYPPSSIFTIDSHVSDSPSVQLADLTPDAVDQLRLVRGHLLYGVHATLPQPALYFSFVREPIDRLVSAYAHVRRTPSHRLYREVVENGLSFAQFVTSGITLETDNWQVRSLAGDEKTPFGACDESTLRRAFDNIDQHFALVGLSERFDESLIVLARMYRWSPVFYASLNRSDSKPSRLTREVQLAVEPHIALERSLYAHAARTLSAVVSNLPAMRMSRLALSGRNAAYLAFRSGRARVQARHNPLR